MDDLFRMDFYEIRTIREMALLVNGFSMHLLSLQAGKTKRTSFLKATDITCKYLPAACTSITLQFYLASDFVILSAKIVVVSTRWRFIFRVADLSINITTRGNLRMEK